MKFTQLLIKHLKIWFVLILLFTSPLFAQENSEQKISPIPSEYLGKLDAELSPDLEHLYSMVFKPIADLSKYKFARPVEKDAFVTVGGVYDPRNNSRAKYEILLIEPKNGIPYFSSDLNANGTIEANEQLNLIAAQNGSGEFAQMLKLPISHPFYKSFPIYLHFKKGFKHPKLGADERLVLQSIYVFALGEVNINNKNVRVQYPFETSEPSISTTEGLFGIDVNGDGKIDNKQFSSETSYAFKDEIVFHLGDLYLSTSKIDLQKNQIVMRQRSAKEYLRQDLEVGKVMSGFSFVDFADKPRTLSEFRGKYLLIDFWGMWCVDCRNELPFQIEAYKRFNKRNFEILGLDSDEIEKLADVKAFLTKNQINWTQAKYDSIKDLIEKTYRIQEYPSAILLDPNGKVLILDQKQISGELLLETLDRILPK